MNTSVMNEKNSGRLASGSTAARPPMPKQPKISILIPSYNQDRFLALTLATVAKQNYEALEVIIMDGASTDRTREVAEAYGSLITTFISEPDEGQLDAMGKAVRAATGDIHYWLNADDAVMPGTFEYVANEFASDSTLDMLYSDDYAFDASTNWISVGRCISRLSFLDHLLFESQMYSECIFWRGELSEKAFPLDRSLRVCTDYSFVLPVRHDANVRWTPRRLAAFRAHSDGNQMNVKFRDRRLDERAKIKREVCDRIGMSQEEFDRLYRRHRLGYLLRHRFRPKVLSGLRFFGRKLTGDRQRRELSRVFFEEWLTVPNDVASNLPPELRSG